MEEQRSSEARQEQAASQISVMSKFFARLTGRDHRAIRRASARMTGRKESMAEMMARLYPPKKSAPAAPPDPTPKTSDDDAGEGRPGATI